MPADIGINVDGHRRTMRKIKTIISRHVINFSAFLTKSLKPRFYIFDVTQILSIAGKLQELESKSFFDIFRFSNFHQFRR